MRLIRKPGRVGRVREGAAGNDFRDRMAQTQPHPITPEWHTDLRGEEMLKAR